jgi:hypothetical protein
MSATSSAPKSLVDNLFVYDNAFSARQLVVLRNAQTLNLVKQIALRNNVFNFVSLTDFASPPSAQQPLITIRGVSPAEALANYSTKFYLSDNVYPEDATWTTGFTPGNTQYEPATALFDKRIIGFETSTFTPAPDQFYFAATTIACSDPNAQVIG